MNVYIFVCSNWNWILIKKRNSKHSSPSLATRNVNSTLGTVCPGGATRHIPALQTLPSALRHHAVLWSLKSAVTCLNLGTSSPVWGSECSWHPVTPACTPGQPLAVPVSWDKGLWAGGGMSSAECLCCRSRDRSTLATPGMGHQPPARCHSCTSWWHLPTCHSFFLS